MIIVQLGMYDNQPYIRIKENEKQFTTFDKQKIMFFLMQISKEFNRAVIKENNLKLYNNDAVLVLKDYDIYHQNQLYSDIIRTINVPIVDRNKVGNINYKRFMASALALSIIFTAGYNIARGKLFEYLDSKGMFNKHNYDSDKFISINETVPSEVIEVAIEKPVEDVETPLETTSNVDEYTNNLITSFVNSGQFTSLEKYANDYQLDPYLFLAIILTESSLDHANTIPGGRRFNGYAYGISQIENVHIGSVVSAFNYTTNQEETVQITENNLIDYDTNVKIGTMLFQNCLNRYKGNTYLAIQSYNYGEKMMEQILIEYANQKGTTVDDVMMNYEDLGWMELVRDAHSNPQVYYEKISERLDTDMKWKEPTYGNSEYVSKVLNNYIGNGLSNQQQVR